MSNLITVRLSHWQLLAIEVSLEKNIEMNAKQKEELLKLLNVAGKNVKKSV